MNTRLYIVVTGMIVLMLNVALAALAQSPIDGFDPDADWFVRAVVTQPDGKILIGGEFTAIQSSPRNRIGRLNPDGTLDPTFNPNVSGSVNCTVNVIVVQTDGKILIGGDFTTLAPNGGATVTRNNIARLNPDGSLDSAFNPNANGIVGSFAVQPDGKVLVGGSFTSIGGQARTALARLDATTGAADSFNPNPNGGFPPTTVHTILVQSDGMILVGGNFLNIGGQARNRIARLDPASGAADFFNPNPNGFTGVEEIAVQPDGKILVGGAFTAIGGQMRNNIARLDTLTGAADSWNPNADNAVHAMALQPDGRVLVGGDFVAVGGVTTNLARISPITGSVEAAFNPGLNERVAAIAVQSDGKILTGGFFTSVGGQARNRIARLETNGRLDRTLEPVISGSAVYATAIQPDGKILIGGDFFNVLGSARNRIARYNADGTLDTAFNPNANGNIYSIAVQPDGKILVGGAFTTIGGQTRSRLARLDATTGAADAFDPGPASTTNLVYVNTIAVQVDGKILVAGSFSTIGGLTRNRIARLDPATGAADSFNPNADNVVGSIAVQADGKILAGGDFSNIGGQPRNFIARLDATTGLADSFNPNASSTLQSIAVQPDGKILAGGNFTTIGGQPRIRMARLDGTTGLADSFNPAANSTVYSIAAQTDGRVLASGAFTSIGGLTRGHIARLDATTGLADSFNPNADVAVFSTGVQTDGKILVGGAFNTLGGALNLYFARLSNATAALQNLAVTQSTITWTRGGSSPQLARVTFESSTDNVTYTPLGSGTATGSNWTLTGLNLPADRNVYIRALGYYHGGYLNGSESITESVRNVFLSPAATISGTVSYGNAIGAPTPRFVSNVLISAAGSPTFSTTTAGPGATAGQYSLTGFGSGPYTVTPSKTGGVNGITSFDAAKIAAHVSGTSFLTGNQLLVADVSNNGVISSFDAAQLARFVTSTPPYGIAGTWKFIPANKSYSSVTLSASGEDFIALLMGEVSGNWTNTGAPPAGPK